MSLPVSQCAFLVEQLDPALADQLARDGDLAPDARAGIASRLRQTLASCAAYIPSRLVRAQIANPQPGRVGGEFWNGSLLFADLSGFTTLSEKLSVLGKQGAEEVSAVVNRLFDALVAEVANYQGMLLKFGGDALTAFFDADHLGEWHAVAAASAALAMQNCMEAFAALETRAGTFQLRLRVGVHSGRVFAAEVGDASHIELVVTGLEVNQVARAQEIAAPGEVVISAQTEALLEGASVEPRDDGFYCLHALLYFSLPPALPNPVPAAGPDDIATLERLAAQVAALRPYLVRGLPGRFLDVSATGLGEFRPVSVLFANFYDFSALLPELGDDAAVAAAVLNAYFRRAQDVVHRYDGAVNKVDMYTHGDKLMALFGAPIAHEDDPPRAVRCALALQQALDEANAEIADLLEPRLGRRIPTLLVQKIGINSGVVFAGRVGGAQRYEYTVMGSSVNLSARLMSAAHDGVVLLSPATCAVVERQIRTELEAPIRLKGLQDPVIPAQALTGAPTTSAPGGSSRSDVDLEHTHLIGREAEMARLYAAAAAALLGAGRILAIVGEAGVGKTRLTEELVQRLVMESVGSGEQHGVPPFMLYSNDCQSYDQRTPYAAIRSPLSHLLGVGADSITRRRRTKRSTSPLEASTPDLMLHDRVEQLAPDLVRFTPLLGDILGIDLPETVLTRALTPQQRHDRVQELIVALWVGAARLDPLLLLFEDLHWADASSQEALERLAQATSDVPLLLLLNYRPDPPISEPWSDLPTTTRLVLGELTPESSRQLLTALLGGAIPNDILPLLDRTQGNPFFIEELVRALVASGTLARNASSTWQLTRPLDKVAVPNSIEGLLIARLDRLDEPRHELVQAASVVGRRFQSLVVAGVYHNDDAPLEEGLQRLITLEIILAEQQERELAFIFRHALLRDVAYEGILYARRRELHQRVAERIEALSGDRPGDHLTLLAWHYLQAESWSSAFNYHLAAGVRAQQRFANREALAFFTTALGIAPRLATSEAAATLINRVAEIHERVGDLRILLGEYDQAETAYQESLALLAARDEAGNAGRVRLHRLLASVHERRSNYEAAFDWLERGMVLGSAASQGELARCYLLGAGIYQRLGNYTLSMEWARMGLQLATRTGNVADQAHAFLLMGTLGYHQGDAGAGIDNLEQACTLAEQINDIARLSDALNNLGLAYMQVGRWQDTITTFERSLQIGESIGDVQATARVSNNLALVLVGRGELQRASDLYKYSGEQFARIGSVMGVAVTTYNRGEVLLLQDQPHAALELFQESLATFERIKSRNFMPEVLRLAAEATLALNDPDQAADYAARSKELAEELGMAVEAAVAERVQGQIALHTGDLAAAGLRLAHSSAALEQLDNRYELGKARFCQARLAYADNRRQDALRWIEQAVQAFSELDAQRDLEQARAFEAALRA